MPYKPKKPCAYPSCPNLTDRRYCEEHSKQEAKRYNKYDRNPESNKRYGRSWKETRAAFLQVHPLCELCKADGKLTPATLVHHEHKVSEGGGNEWSNLQALCTVCHNRLHAEQGDRWG
ncbi:HNH endonuclease [Clostridia bacterium]|nr:HNH endonuclease [Clostridia bacterium]